MAPRTDDALPRSRTFTVFLAVVCAVLAVQVLLLTGKVRSLESALAAERESDAGDGPFADPAAARPSLEPGDFLEPLELVSSRGERTRLAFEGEAARTVLFVMAESCPACTDTAPLWAELASRFGDTARIVGLHMDLSVDLADSVWAGLPFEVHHLVEPRAAPLAKMMRVPITVVLDEAGMVLWVRYAKLTRASADELAALLAG